MEEHSHDEPEDAEREAAIAEMALAQGDPPHALHHLANALFDTVGEDTYFELARRVLAASSIEALFDPNEGLDRRLAAKAVLLHLAGRDPEAIELLAQVAAYRVDLPDARSSAPPRSRTRARSRRWPTRCSHARRCPPRSRARRGCIGARDESTTRSPPPSDASRRASRTWA